MSTNQNATPESLRTGDSLPSFFSNGGQDGKEAVLKVHSTTDYDQFGFHRLNRQLDQSHVQQLVESFEEYGFLPQNHLIVDENMTVIDGQHRLAAAREAGVEVYYTVYEGEYTIDLIQQLNNTDKNWSLEDHVWHWAQQGKDDYLRVLDVVEENEDLPISAVAYACGSSVAEMRSGDFEWGDDDFVEGVMAVLSAVRSEADYTFAHRKQFVGAVRRELEIDEIESAQEMAQKAGDAGRRGDLEREDTAQGYVMRANEAWNH